MKRMSVGVVLVASILMMACAPTPKPRVMSIQQPIQMRVMSVGAPTASSQINVHDAIPESFDSSTWQLVQIRGQRMNADALAPIIKFDSGMLTGFTGCKNIEGSYERDGVDFWITGFHMDSQPCDAVLIQHQWVEWVLMQVRHIRIVQSNGYLALLDDYNNLLAELKPITQN